ncbi:MAG: hypothetical protein JJ975_10245 [Bacteroidia bacterium]|nr:hypothetical protein [Bacteroidia bacterium]
MNTIELFKKDLWNGIWIHGKALLKPMAVVFIGFTLISYGLMYLGVRTVYGEEFVEAAFNQEEQAFDFDKMMERNTELQALLMEQGTATIVAGSLVLLLVMLVLFSLFTNFMLTTSQDTLEGNNVGLGTSFSRSLGPNVFKIALCYIFIFVLYIGLLFAIIGLARISVALVFPGLFFVLATLLRFGSAPAGIVHGEQSVIQALGESFRNIGYGKAFKLILVLFVGMILLGLLGLLLTSVFSMMGSVGDAVGTVVQVALSLLLYAVLFSAMSASFYRYAEVEYEVEKDHLIDDSAQF